LNQLCSTFHFLEKIDLMTSTQPVRVAMIGCGGMARHHIKGMLKQTDTTQITWVCEPSPAAYDQAAALFKEAGLQPPRNEPDFEALLSDHAGELDIAFIITPHAQHHDQAEACLKAGLDVLVEKPMVMNAAEAVDLIKTRDNSGKLLAVAFNGSMSPQIRTAVKMLRSGEMGEMLNIQAAVWQNWANLTAGTWRQDPPIAGGGYLFDTGAHMLNTVVDLAGEEFVEVAAWIDNRSRPVDILGVVIGKLKSGALVTLNGCGDSGVTGTDIRVMCTKGMLRTGVWGGFLEAQRQGETELRPVPVPESLGTWQQFLAVRKGTLQNPCPPEVGLRMAKLWDAIKASAAKNGAPVQV
jgi:predicted dehydrogenase